MLDGLDIIIIDDDQSAGEHISTIIKKFYTWGEIFIFTDLEEAMGYCLNRNVGIAIFIVEVFLKEASGFYFLDAINEKFPTVHKDTIMITGNASDDIVNMCIASDVNYLLEKPIKPYTLQLAVRAITGKYLEFAKKLLNDPDFADGVAKLQITLLASHANNN
jgi:response regulator of citrate/malate metabolism